MSKAARELEQMAKRYVLVPKNKGYRGGLPSSNEHRFLHLDNAIMTKITLDRTSQIGYDIYEYQDHMQKEYLKPVILRENIDWLIKRLTDVI